MIKLLCSYAVGQFTCYFSIKLRRLTTGIRRLSRRIGNGYFSLRKNRARRKDCMVDANPISRNEDWRGQETVSCGDVLCKRIMTISAYSSGKTITRHWMTPK